MARVGFKKTNLPWVVGGSWGKGIQLAGGYKKPGVDWREWFMVGGKKKGVNLRVVSGK